MLFIKISVLIRSFFLVAALSFTLPLLANLPYSKIVWPYDDQPHFGDPRVITERWHFTGKLDATDGDQTKHFAYHVALRYTRDLSGETPSLDVQLTDIDEKKVYGNSIQLSDVKQNKGLRISSKDFSLHGNNGKYNLKLIIPTKEGSLGLNLVLTSQKKPLLIGPNPQQRGLLDMGNETNCFHYSITRLHTAGVIQLGGDRFTIHPDINLSRSWMDHQWGDFSLADARKTNPWIWTVIQLGDGTDIHVGGLISAATGEPISEHLANISLYNGRTQYQPAKIIPGSKKEAGYPVSYLVQINNVSYRLQSIVPNQHKNAIWKGIMNINGHNVLEPNAPFAIVENTAPPQ
jgi:predicted secreted hydrolase